jgi:hypothetical protein
MHAQRFAGGVAASGMTARFIDGKQQRMDVGKFVYDCGRSGFTHIVIVTANVAH